MAVEQPKKPVGGAFGQFVAEKRPEFLKQCAGQKASAVATLASAEWKKFTEAQKAPYQTKYEAAKKKFDEDMAAFVAAGGQVSKGAAGLRAEKRKAKEGKGKPAKDPNRPKKPAGGAYGCFLAKHRAEFQKECPGSMTGVAKLAGEKWKALPAKDKVVYEDEYKLKQDAYQQAMKSYVPPAGTDAEGEEDGEEDEEEEAEEEKEVTAPPAKKAKTSAVKATGAKAAKRSAAAEQEPSTSIPQDVLVKAEKAGMAGTLKKILGRDDIKSKGVVPKDALAALEAADGLLHKARHALLGA